MGPLGELGALFNPGMRHETEEKLAKQMLREEEGTGRKGRLGIDLESGVAVIGANGASGDESDDADAAGKAESAAGSDDDADGKADDDAADDDDDDSATSTGEATTLKAPGAPPARPGEPQPAARTSSAVPSGKARRKASRSTDGKERSPAGRYGSRR